MRTLCPPQKVLRDFKRGSQLGPYEAHVPHSAQGIEKLWRIAQSFAKLPRPGASSFNFRRAPAFNGDERWADGKLQAQFPLDALGVIRQSLEQIDRCTETSDCIGMRRALHGLLARAAEVFDRLVDVIAVTI